VKLLFDENVSPRLTDLLAAEYPESRHVRDVGLAGQPDQQIWNYARDNGLTIVSKDDDFRQRSFLNGAPPKIVWLQVGNAGTAAIADLLRREAARLREFEGEAESALLILRAAV
jgi:predicted nuclease of predicted toxin-antitoxin system